MIFNLKISVSSDIRYAYRKFYFQMMSLDCHIIAYLGNDVFGPTFKQKVEIHVVCIANISTCVSNNFNTVTAFK